MARGPSGRIVAELDPDLKTALYAVLARENLTLKEWLARQARKYLEDSRQPSLFVPATEPKGRQDRRD